MAEYQLRPGDVVIGMDRTFAKSGAKISLVQGRDCPCLLVQRVGKFVPLKCSGRFLWALLSGERFRKALEAEQKGMDIPHLSRSEILGPFIAFTPVRDEQESIAEVLLDADALIESLEQLVAKKRAIKQGAMQELLRPQVSWTERLVGDLLTVAHGKSQKAVVSSNGIHPILGSGGQIGSASRFLYDKPSVLIGRKGTIDRPQYMDRPFWSVDTLFYSLIHEPNSARYIYYQFCMIDWRSHNEGSGVPSLNARTIERIALKVPPPGAANPNRRYSIRH